MSSINDRYENNVQIKKLANGKMVYSSLRPKSISPNLLADAVITSTQIARMDVLSQNAYGTAIEWWRIAAANGRVDGSLYFRPGSTIIIPQ